MPLEPPRPLPPLTNVAGATTGDRSAEGRRSGVPGGVTGTGGVGAVAGVAVAGEGMVRMATVTALRISARCALAPPVNSRGGRVKQDLTAPARMDVAPRDVAALAPLGSVAAALLLRAISG